MSNGKVEQSTTSASGTNIKNDTGVFLINHRSNSSSDASSIKDNTKNNAGEGSQHVKYKSIDKLNKDESPSHKANLESGDKIVQNERIAELPETSRRNGSQNQSNEGETPEDEQKNSTSNVQNRASEAETSQNRSSGGQHSRGSSYNSKHRVVPVQPRLPLYQHTSRVQDHMDYDTAHHPLPPATSMGFQRVTEIAGARKGAWPRPIYKLQMFRFVEIANKRVLFHLAKSAAVHQIFFTIFPILLVSSSLIGPWYYRDRLLQTSLTPFSSFLATGPDPSMSMVSGHVPTSGYHVSISNQQMQYSGFNESNPSFDAARRTSQAEFSVILSTKNRFGNVLKNRTLKAFSQLIEQIHAITIRYAQMTLEWSDMCREQCSTSFDDPNNIAAVVRALQTNKLLLKYPEAVWLNNEWEKEKFTIAQIGLNMTRYPKVFIANWLGDVELDADNIVTRARSLLFNIKLKESLSSTLFAAFEEKLTQTISNFTLSINDTASGSSTNLEDVSINWWSVRAYVREVVGSFKTIHIRLILCSMLLILICLGFSFTGDSYKSCPFVGLKSAFAICLSCVAAYSVHIFASTGNMNSTLFPTIFIIESVAILLVLSMQQCWQRYVMVALHPVEKLAFIYSWDVPQLAMCLMVIILGSVGAGLVSPIPYLQQCFFAMAAGFASFMVLSLFFLTVCWYKSAKRAASGLKWFHCFRQGDETFNNKFILDYDELTAAKLHEKLTDLKPSFSRSIGRLASNYNLRTVAVALFTVFLIFSLLGTNWMQGPSLYLREEHFVSSESASASYLRKFRTAFDKYEHYLELTIDAPGFDYYDQRNKELVFGLMKWAMDNEMATKAVSWLMDFERFQKSTIYDVNPDTLVPILNYVFLKTDNYRKYAADIAFDKFQTQILRSRMYLELNSRGVAKSEWLVSQLLQKAKALNLPITIKAPYTFSLQHDLQTFPSCLWTFAWLLAILAICCIIVFTNPAISFCVPFSCLIVSIGVLGFAHHLAVPINVLTLGVILFGNLFTAAVAIHYCYMFSNSGPTQQTNTQRVEYAFQCTLRPTVLACLSLVVLYTPFLLFDDATPMIWHMWKMLLGTALICFLNYLLVLPSVLIILSDYLTSCCMAVGRMCDENGACCTVEQPADSIYFVPQSRVDAARRNNAIMYGGNGRSDCYISPNYMINSSARMLPPAYDHYRPGRSIMALPPPLPLPPPPLPTAMEYLDSEQDEVVIVPDRHFRSGPHQRSPGLRSGRMSMGVDSARYQIHEATDSNCDSLDSRGLTASSAARRGSALGQQSHIQAGTPHSASAASSRHQTPMRERRNQVHPVNSVNIHQNAQTQLPMNAERRRQAYQQQTQNGDNNEQIYEEPESPIQSRRYFASSTEGNFTTPTSRSFLRPGQNGSQGLPDEQQRGFKSASFNIDSAPRWRHNMPSESRGIPSARLGEEIRRNPSGRQNVETATSPNANRRYHYKF
ncbi:patched family domain-containing protein [Ditylenchus destructor]|nr:patched family domain-containing protein [Ditylenchus destructor]